MSDIKPLILLVLDGWGHSEHTQHNAITSANTPNWDEWWSTRPHLLLDASGTPVGLPAEQMGNSEVGHMHIGAGRVIPQDFTRINDAIADGSFYKNPVFIDTLNILKNNAADLHIMGLLSDGGVHSHEEHLFAFLKLCYEQNFKRVYLHLFTDGRDTSPRSAIDSLNRLNAILAQYPGPEIVSLCGRYFAMDRDQRWHRMAPIYHLLTTGESQYHFATASDAVNNYYQQDINDEFIPATRIGAGKAIRDHDAVFFFNYRSDRARQLTQLLLDPQAISTDIPEAPRLSSFVSMTRYAKKIPTTPAYAPISLKNTLGELVSAAGLSQLRIAETEKYAHVTFFFNGGNEQVFPNEDRILIQSPSVATYDLQPEMSAPELTTALVDAIKSNAYDVIIANYANADMVGHTGNFDATVQAIECLDECLGEIYTALETVGGNLLITADHGNAEEMYDEDTQQAHTAHTCELVPLLFVGNGWKFDTDSGSLIDIAPTMLRLLNLKQPVEMTGHSLLVEDHA